MDAAFRRYVEECPDAVMATDREGRIEYVNAACERLTGYRREELVGRTPALLKSGSHEADFYRRLWQALLAGEDFRAVFCNRRKNGELYYEDKIVRPLETGFIAFGRDVTARALEVEQLAHDATHDSLTELPNRRLFLDRLEQAVHHAARRGESLVAAIVDLDRFRGINTRFGHLGGDAALKAVASRTLACVRTADTVARIGGDEFALILVDTRPDDAARVLQKILDTNAAPVAFDGGRMRVTLSIGACSYPDEAQSGVALLREADRRMYLAKHAGGNRLCSSG